MQNWQTKVLNICAAMRVPCYIFSAMAKDQYRKPHRGMWEAFEDIWTQELGRRLDELAMTGRDLTSDVSFYVGDFAGRHGDGVNAADHRDTDRKFAINAGLKFFTPEEYFQQSKQRRPFALSGFDARSFLANQSSESIPS